MHSARLLMAIAGFALLCASAQAADFCVDTGAELQQALSAAQSNGEADTIKIETGTYSLPGGAIGFEYFSSQGFALSIEGGYSGGLLCGRKRNVASLTVLSGGGAQQVMRLRAWGDGTISVKNLSIRDGDSATDGGGLYIGDPGSTFMTGYVGDVNVERVIFEFNQSDTRGGALYIASNAGLVRVNGSLFAFNQCAGDYCALLVESPNTPVALPVLVYLGGNTLTVNRCSNGAPIACNMEAAGFEGRQHVRLYHNLFAFQTAYDLYAYDPDTEVDLYYNNIDQVFGTLDDEVGSMNIDDPLFIDVLGDDFRLQSTSPMLNHGNAPLPPTSIDLNGRTRIIGSAPDLGAYEFNPALFDDGFEEEP